jgi:hypothetical protein
MCCFLHYNGRACVLQHGAVLVDTLQVACTAVKSNPSACQHMGSYLKTAAANHWYKKRAG